LKEKLEALNDFYNFKEKAEKEIGLEI